MAERLWAPWRMSYIKDDKPGEEGCLFCRVAASGEDERNLVVLRGERTLLMLNAFPYNSGHLMAVPLRHTADFTSLTPEEALELTSLVQRGIGALNTVYQPQGYNVGINLGTAAGAGIADHLHVHIVPRWVGDTNFMAATGDTRVLPESLEDTWRRVKEALETP